jgi:hypothetical protein
VIGVALDLIPPAPAQEHSWVDLLASAVGLESFGRSRLRVAAKVPYAGELRLVVQVFGRGGGWPVGALERVVTAQELRQGVDVQVLHDAGSGAAHRLLAWVEPNARELEFGALTAQPQGALALGEAPVRGGSQALVLAVPVGAVVAAA